MKPVVVTGADGFIGTSLLTHLSQQGVEVYAIVMEHQPSTAGIASLPNVHVISWDFKEAQTILPALPHGPAALYHLAWAGVAPELRATTELQRKNIDLALSCVALAADMGAERFVLPGSTMEYVYTGQPINRHAVPTPQNAYGAAKLSCRYLCQALAGERGIPFLYTVVTGVYGGSRLDNNVITYTIQTLLRGQAPQLTPLEQLWDYVHIDDLCEALTQIGQKGKPGGFYAIGHGDNWPLANYIEQIRNVIDPALPLGVGAIPYATSDMPSSCIDLTELRADTGFVPQIAFQDGIVDVIAQIQARLLEQG